MKNDTHYLLTPDFQPCGKGLGPGTILKVARTDQPVTVVIVQPDGASLPMTLEDDGETQTNVPSDATIMARCDDPKAALIVGERDD